MGKTVPTFAKYKPTFKSRKTRGDTKVPRTEYFIPYQMMTLKMQKAYKDQLIEFDDEAQEVEDVIGDVTEGIELLPNSSAELTEARLDNLKARTALINEKLEQKVF